MSTNTIPMHQRRVLQLNKTWAPMHTVPLEKALHMVFNDRAKIVDPENYQAMTWEDWSKLKPLGDEGIKGAKMVFRIPEVIVLNDYDKLPQPAMTFSRRRLFRRDGYKCMYCGCKPGSEELTIDHVLPRAQGGGTNWENCVLCCVKCNAYKANRTPEQAKMVLLSKPCKPSYKILRKEDFVPIDSWSKFISTSYWNVPLED